MRWLDDDLDDLDDNEPVVPDEPWCGEFDEHDCLGADCPRRPTMRDVGTAGREPQMPVDEAL